MSQILNSLFTEDEIPENIRLSYLTLSKEIGFKEGKSLELIVKNIKTYLSSSKFRYKGLTYLTNIVFMLDNDLFRNNCSFWLQTLIKILQESKNNKERILAYKVVTQILVKIYKINLPNLIRELSLGMAPVLIQIFAELRSKDVYYACNCISVCATLFPGLVSAKRNLIGNKIIETVSNISNTVYNNEVKILKTLGFCYAKVILTSSSVTRWREFLSKLMNTFKEFLNLYKVFSLKKQFSNFKFDNNETLKNIYKDSSDIFVDPVKYSKKLYFVSSAINSLITGSCSSIFPVPVEAILECLTNFMSVSNFNVKENSSIDIIAVGHVLPIVYQNVFDILKALLLSCKSNLIIYTRQINHIVVSTIDWLDKLKSVERNTFINVRCCVYDYLSLYFNLLGSNSCFSTNDLSLIVNHMLNNIKLTDSKIVFYSNNSNLAYSDPNVNIKNIDSKLLALKVLKSILNSIGPILDNTTFGIIQNAILCSLLYVYRNWYDLPMPFKNEKCRQELIEILKLILQNSSPNCNPPIETAIVIFNEAYRLDKSESVRYLVSNCFHVVNFITSSRIPITKNSFNAASLTNDSHPTERSDKVEKVPSEENIISVEPKTHSSITNTTSIIPVTDITLSSGVNLKRKIYDDLYLSKNKKMDENKPPTKKCDVGFDSNNPNQSHLFEKAETLVTSKEEKEISMAKNQVPGTNVEQPTSMELEIINPNQNSSNLTTDTVGDVPDPQSSLINKNSNEKVSDVLDYFVID